MIHHHVLGEQIVVDKAIVNFWLQVDMLEDSLLLLVEIQIMNASFVYLLSFTDLH